MKKISVWALLALSLTCALPSAYSQTQVEFPETLPACPAEFLTDSLLASDGSIWVSSEGKGIFRRYPGKNSSGKNSNSENEWMDASYFRGLPDTLNFYALAEDKQGRIWAGTDNKGVAVFNGETWKIYDRENALLGERIFDIAVSPKTGDVAVATSGGISIFQPSKGDWVSLTRAEGLVEDQVETLAYDNKGTLWVGYACGGVSQLSEKENYRVVKTDQAKWYWDENNRVRQPMDGAGTGLPSNLCNALLPTKNGMILLGTNSGLALKKGQSEWRYFRGKDYRDKNKGLWDVQIDTATESKASPLLLPEDYITCLTETNEGCWVGFRQKGVVLINPSSLKVVREGKFGDNVKTPFVKSLLAFPDNSVYAVTYGHGIIRIHDGKGRNQMRTATRKGNHPHPSVIPVKSLEQLNQEAKKLHKCSAIENIDNIKEIPKVVFCQEDWATQGDWTESYGREYALLCGTCDMGNDIIVDPETEVQMEEVLGPHKKKEDCLSVRPHDTNALLEPNVLFNPRTCTRVATEWSDNGEEYLPNFDGPDIWINMKVPKGKYVISLYFHNYQARDLNIGFMRDFIIEWRYREIDDSRKINNKFVISRSRVKNFFGSGVYKTFIINNPGDYNIRILNNYSSDTILNGIFVDQVNIFQNKIDEICRKVGISISKGEFLMLAKEISRERIFNLSLYRYLKSSDHIQKFRRILNIWNQNEHELVQNKMLKEWHKKQDEYATYRSQEFFPFSPRTISFTAQECEAMDYMGINWKDYLPDNENRPKINPMDLKEKISSISQSDFNKLKNQYNKKIIEEIAKTYKNQMEFK